MTGNDLPSSRFTLVLLLLMLALSPSLGIAMQDGPRVDGDDPAPVTGERDLPPGAVLRFGSAWLQTGRPVKALAVLPEGRTILSGGRDGILRRWDIATRRVSVVFETSAVVQGGTLGLDQIAVSPDGKRVLVASSYVNLLFSLNLEGGFELLGGGVLDAAPGRIIYLADGKAVALGGRNGKVLLLDAVTGRTLATLRGHPSPVTALSSSPDAGRLASGHEDGIVRIWGVEERKELRKVETGSSAVVEIALTPDGKELIVASDEGPPSVWHVDSGQKVRTFQEQKGDLGCLALSPDGGTLAGGTIQGNVVSWTVEDGKIDKICKGHTGRVNAVRFLPDGRGLVSGTEDGTIRVWDTTTGRQVEPPAAEAHGAIHDLAWSPDGRTIAVAEKRRTIRILDANTGRPIRSLTWKDKYPSVDDTEQVQAIGISPDGKELAAISRFGGVHRWNLLTGEWKGKLAYTFDGSVHDLAYLPGGGELLYWSSANHLRRWSLDGEAKEPLWTVTWGREARHQGGPRAVSISPDGSVALTPAGDGAIRLCDTSTGRKIWKYTAHADHCRSVAFSPDGRRFASAAGRSERLGGTEPEIRIYETATCREETRLVGHESEITALEYSPTESLLASSSRDGTVRLWDPERGVALGTLSGHKGDVGVLAFSPDGQRLATGGAEGTVVIWNPWEPGVQQRETRPPPPTPTPEDLNRAWAELAEGDAAASGKAIYTLAHAPGQALPYIKERLQARPEADHERILELVAMLDNDEFKVRERATQELTALGDAAHPSLREAADSEVAAEMRMRIKKILEATTFPVRHYPSEALRRSRCVEVLERMGTEEAMDVLREMATNPATAHEGKEARAGLLRLESSERKK